MNDIEDKQKYLRENILDKGYDPNDFSSFLTQKKDKYEEVDIGTWDIDYLKNCVEEFIALNKPKIEKRNEENLDLKLNDKNNSRLSNSLSHFDINRSFVNMSNDTIKCEYVEETNLSKTDNVVIQLALPEIIEESGLFFAKSDISYTVKTIPFDYLVKRKYSDFEWLRNILLKVYLGSVIPLIPKKLTENQHTVTKSMKAIELFLQTLILNPLIKRSQILFDFLTIGTEPNFVSKKNFYSKLSPPIHARELKSITGEMRVNISSEQETYFINIKDNVNINESILTKLASAYKELAKEMLSTANRMKIISDLWKQLLRTSEEYADNQNIINTYLVMSKLMSDWSEMQTTQETIISSDIRDYFKFHRNEFKSFKPLIAKVELTQSNYYNEHAKVNEKKESLFRKKDIAKWDLDPNNLENKQELLNDKKLAVIKMLPKETQHVNELKELYGCFINSLIDEFQRQREINSQRHKARIKLFAQNYSLIISKMHLSIADVISYE